MKKTTGYYMRVVHRYLGFFLAGIMAMYAISGTILVFRETDFLKRQVQHQKTIATNVSVEKLGSVLKIKGLKVNRQDAGVYYFKNGSYNSQTGEATWSKKELPYILNKMTHLHKATTNRPLYVLNIFFGVSLLFFVISSFWMFMPSTSVFKKGMLFTLGGIVLTLILLFI